MGLAGRIRCTGRYRAALRDRKKSVPLLMVHLPFPAGGGTAEPILSRIRLTRAIGRRDPDGEAQGEETGNAKADAVRQ